MEMKSLSYKSLRNTGLGMVFKCVMMVILLSVVAFSAAGQDMIVRSLEAKTFDISASKYKRLDLNKQPCALVKVQLAAPGAAFEGNVIGEVEYKVCEYWVYMSSGSRRVAIKCPNYLPVMVEFVDYGIKALESNTTYELVVSLPVYGVSPAPTVGQEETTSISELHPENSVQQSENQPFNQERFEVNGVVFEMVYVPGGTFTMGATAEQGDDAYDREKPAHSVTLSGYYIGKYEVTQAQWKSIMGKNPSWFKGDNLPVEWVSWNDCQEFIRKLNQLTGKKFSLPTEAQWEYAARGGKSGGTKYSGSNNIGNVAWYYGNSGSKTHPVGEKSPNDLGLYDMSGNVSEWCQDWAGDYSSYSQTNPTGHGSGSGRVFRGGSLGSYARACRVSNRSSSAPDRRFLNFGFRLCLSISE
ncbi:MAG: formylglycine-generating enzyme family protein [Muribaculaceae bacterium]